MKLFFEAYSLLGVSVQLCIIMLVCSDATQCRYCSCMFADVSVNWLGRSASQTPRQTSLNWNNSLDSTDT